HRARGHEERRLLAEQPGRGLLEPVDARVLAVDVVADRGAGHHLAHRRRGTRHGVAAQIDALHPAECTSERKPATASRTGPGCSRWTLCPAPAISTRRAPRIPAAISSAPPCESSGLSAPRPGRARAATGSSAGAGPGPRA